MALQRETIHAALAARLSGIAGVVSVRRSYVEAETLDASEQPAICLSCEKETPAQERGRPTVWRMEFAACVYVKDADGESGGARLNEILTAIESALERANGELPGPGANFLDFQNQRHTSLGGLVSHCWISGEVLRGTGKLSDQIVAIVPIEVVATA
jgi:hypothetical protein